jgi:hypothetical protein
MWTFGLLQFLWLLSADVPQSGPTYPLSYAWEPTRFASSAGYVARAQILLML